MAPETCVPTLILVTGLTVPDAVTDSTISPFVIFSVLYSGALFLSLVTKNITEDIRTSNIKLIAIFFI